MRISMAIFFDIIGSLFQVMNAIIRSFVSAFIENAEFILMLKKLGNLFSWPGIICAALGIPIALGCFLIRRFI